MKKINWKLFHISLWVELFLAYVLPLREKGEAFYAGFPAAFLTMYEKKLNVNLLSSMHFNPFALLFDVILLDTAAGLGAPFQAAKACAGQALLVLTPDPVALRDGRVVSDTLFDSGMPEIRLILNRVTPQSFTQGTVRDLDECIDTVCAQLLGVVPDSAELQLAAANGTALPHNCLAFTALDNMARRLDGERIALAVQ